MRKRSAKRLIAAAVLAITALTATNTAAETPATYASLTPGGQSIARALHRAQLQGDGSGGISLDRIAAIKSAVPGWGPVFDHMKARGLIAGRSLGLVILGPRRVAASRARRAKPGAIVITSATGRQVSFIRARPRRRAQTLPLRAVAGQAPAQYAGSAPRIVSGATAPVTVRGNFSGMVKGRGRKR
jgi:hypothetical protein